MPNVSRQCREDIVMVVVWSQRFESMLSRYSGSRGGGLIENLRIVQSRLPDDLVRKLRYIAHQRNRVVHEAGATIDDRAKFESACKEAEKQLAELTGVRRSSFFRKFAIAAILVLGVATAAYFFLKSRGVIDWP